MTSTYKFGGDMIRPITIAKCKLMVFLLCQFRLIAGPWESGALLWVGTTLSPGPLWGVTQTLPTCPAGALLPFPSPFPGLLHTWPSLLPWSCLSLSQKCAYLKSVVSAFMFSSVFYYKIPGQEFTGKKKWSLTRNPIETAYSTQLSWEWVIIKWKVTFK